MGLLKFGKSLIAKMLYKDGSVLAPELSWRTSFIGANCRYFKDSMMNTFKPNKSAKAFEKIMIHNPTVEDAAKACKILEKETGLKCLMTNPQEAYAFQNVGHTLIRDVKQGRFPKDIKYMIFGHGEGCSLNNTWRVANTDKKIFDIVQENVPKGEKVLVISCEVPDTKEIKRILPKNKPAIGHPVTELYSTYHTPSKIVQSGRNEIIGGYANGIATYYL